MQRNPIAAAAAAFTVMTAAHAGAAELKLFHSTGLKATLGDLIPMFEKASGHKVTTVFGGPENLKGRVMGNEPFDVLVVNSVAFDELVKAGKFPAGSKTILAHSGIGVAVRAGAPKPDISTPDKFRQALLDAKSIITGNPAGGGTSSVHFARVIERLGIAKEVNAKSKFSDGGFLAEEVANGHYEIGIQQVGELLPVKGIEIVGEFPGDLNFVSYYATAVSPAAGEPDVAKAFIQFITSPDSAPVYTARGLHLN